MFDHHDECRLYVTETFSAVSFSGGFVNHARSWGAPSWLFAIVTPFTDPLALVIVHRAFGRSKAAAAVQSMGALILVLMSPQIHVVTAASFGLIDDGIEQPPTDARAPSLGKHIDQAQEPCARNHIAASAIRAEGVDERHRHGFCAVAADQKPRGCLVTSGIVETGCDLSDAC
jgi:hypothetical protein